MNTIEKLGGKAIRDETRNGKPVVGVNLSLSAVKDSDLKELTKLKSLANLSLANTRVRETGANELKKSLPNCKIVR